MFASCKALYNRLSDDEAKCSGRSLLRLQESIYLTFGGSPH